MQSCQEVSLSTECLTSQAPEGIHVRHHARIFAGSSAAAPASAAFGFKPARAETYPARPVTLIVLCG
jgi:hypothetical protein